MEKSLLRAFDALVKKRGSKRSEVLRDLARAEVTKSAVAGGGDAVATVTIVYDHHVRDLTESLNELQHALGGTVRSTLHVHLDEAHCLEVIVAQGPADELQAFADRVFATRGVKHGGIEMIATGRTPADRLHVHLHEHDHEGTHHHADGHTHDHGHGPHSHGHGPHSHGPHSSPRRSKTR